METPKVSIIIPVYNTELYLERCLQSVLGQTEQNWECILVDDGSKDASGAMCDEYAIKDSRFKVYHRSNHGPSSTRNYGLDYARGEFICFIDSDDYVNVEFLRHLIEPMERDEKIKMTVVGLKKFGNEVAKFPAKAYDKTLSSKSVFNHLLKGDIIKGWLCNKCFRRELIGNYRLNETLRFCEDLELELRLTFYKPEFDVKFVDVYDYFYNIQSGCVSLSHNARNKIIMIDAFNQCLDGYPDTEPKRIRLLKGCLSQCRALATVKDLNSEDNAVINKAKHTIYRYRKEAMSLFSKRQKLQLLLIMLSFRLYKIVIS